MKSARSLPLVGVLGLVVVLGIGIWLLSATPGSVLDDEPGRFGPTLQPDEQTVIVTVADGDGASDIGERLENAGVIQSRRLFVVLTALMSVGGDLEAGDYEFRLGDTALSAVRRISQGRTAIFGVTVPEGRRLEEIAQIMEQEGIVAAEEFLAALDGEFQANFLERLPEGASLEGFLFPATYNFPLDITPHDVVQRMLTAFDERLQQEIQEPLESSTLTLFEAVTLASIVEREAVVPEERSLIAGVFHNRLDAGLALDADPTVQYAVAADPASVEEFGYWKQELTAADLALDSPYNTYVFPGLPPGPIANPGLDSILAAIQPVTSEYIYFVACQDGSGRHLFAETLDEQIANIAIVESGECPS